MGRLTRIYLALIGAVGLAAGVVLLAAPGATADYFAWPIAPPQTAVFMGAGYLGTGVTLTGGLLLARTWSQVRLIIPPIVLFALAMVAATVLHADRFRWDRAVAWVWIGLYIFVVAGAGTVQLAERRRSAPNALPSPLTRAERGVVLAAGIVTASWALPLFVVPGLASIIWPWQLTPLTGRVVAGWIAVGAAIALLGGWANDVRGLQLPLLGWTVTVGTLVVASAVDFSAFAVGDLRTPLYFLALTGSAVGAAGLLVRVHHRLQSVGREDAQTRR